MAPEVYGAQVLPDPDYSDPPPPKTGTPYNLFFFNFHHIKQLRLQRHARPR